ncbi:MAG: SusE domain-containing protein [Muribaculaceae bacterium]|nr:SusE domain-containing protein [Muribaculaceae bacterium]
MKKLSYFLFALAAVAGLTACNNSDKDNVLKMPEKGSFKLETPKQADQRWDLNKNATFELNTNIPDYGNAGPIFYYAEVAMDEAFSNYLEIAPATNTSNKMTFKENDLNAVINALLGMTGETFVDPGPKPVYLRAVANLNGNESTEIKSNVVCCKEVQIYRPAGLLPGCIWMIGAPGGWTEPSEANAAALEAWKLTETGIATDVYNGSFEITKGTSLMFRFYTELTGWDGGNSIGIQEPDEAVSVEFDAEGVFNGDFVKGKGAWNFGEAKSDCTLSLTVDFNTNKVTFKLLGSGEIDWDALPCIYMIGAPGGWKEPSEANKEALADWRLYDVTGNGVYVSKEPFVISAGTELMFRFYTALTGWDGGNSIGIQEPDESVSVEFDANGVFNGDFVIGKGNWSFGAAASDCTLDLTVDMNTSKVNFVRGSVE